MQQTKTQRIAQSQNFSEHFKKGKTGSFLPTLAASCASFDDPLKYSTHLGHVS
jgi:hypothetical protein